MKLRMTILLFISLVLFLSSCTNEKIDTNMSQKVDNFEFTTQDNDEFELKELKGDWWIVYFMYTECTMVCPRTTPNMVSIQEELKEYDFQIISFTVNPEDDTPEVLREYAKDYDVDLSNWTFLTTDDSEKVKELSEGSFRSVLQGGGPSGMEFSHSYNFFLVNPQGEVIKKYDGLSSDDVDEVIDNMQVVLN